MRRWKISDLIVLALVCGIGFAEGSQIGIVFGLLCAVLAWWLFEPSGRGPREAEGRHGTESGGS